MAQMLEASSGQYHADLESQQTTVLVITSGGSSRRFWRRIYMILKVHRILFSIRLVKEKGNQLGAISSSTLPYRALPGAATAEIESEVIERKESPTPLSQVSRDDVHLNIVEDQSGTTNNSGDVHKARIAKMVRTKDLQLLKDFGGIKGVAKALDTDLENGIPGDEEDLRSRRRAIGTPAVPIAQATEAPAPGLFGFLGRHCNDCTILLLFLAAVLYTGFGIKKEGPKTGWHQGVIIFIAIIILVAAPTIRDLWLKHSRRKNIDMDLREKNEVDVFRAGRRQHNASISDVVLGDVVCLNEGSLVPADGLFIDGEFFVVHDGLEYSIDEESPFLFHGSKVGHGSARMLVTSVGTDTELGEAMSKVAGCIPKGITLPAQLDKLRKITQITVLSITILVIFVLFLSLMLGRSSHMAKPGLPELKSKPTTSVEIMDALERIVRNPSEKASTRKAPLAIVLVGVLEGIPFVIALAAIYWRKKMLSGKAYAPGLLDCVKMGSATTICTDKTLLNPADVAMCFIGDDQVIETGFINVMAQPVHEALCSCISSTLVMPSNPYKETEDPLLPWAASNLELKLDILSESCTVVKTKGLSSNEEGSGVLMKKKIGDGREILCLHWKGPAMTILGKCSSYHDKNGEMKVLNEEKRKLFERNIEQMRLKGLKTVAFAFKQIGHPVLEENELTLAGMMGLKYSFCAETKKAVKAIKDAGVKIRLVSGDDASVLEDIARACKILPTDGLVIKGEDFQQYGEDERMDKVDKIFVMGNSSPSDRLLLVQCLKKKGDVVVGLGTRTNDSPMLKEADLGVAMGSRSNEMARESSDIVAYDGSLSSLLAIISCGRCTYHNIQKFIQLELVTNMAGTLIASLTTISLGDSPITGIHLIWANIVVTFLAGPALLMEPPRDELMHKSPVRQTDPLISKHMWRNIVIQAIYQTTILVIFQYKGQAIMGITRKVSKSMIFNSFVLCQVFNQVNSRELENMNVFKGIHRNPWFWVAVVITVALQECFIEVAHILVGSARLNLVQWSVCVLIGTCSCPVDLAAKCASKFIKDQKLRSHVGSTTMTHSSSSDSVSNLELPLMTTSNSTSVPS